MCVCVRVCVRLSMHAFVFVCIVRVDLGSLVHEIALNLARGILRPAGVCAQVESVSVLFVDMAPPEKCK